MESAEAMLLARDVLADHFGASVQRVGRVLLQQGPLSVQDLLRTTARDCDIDEEPLTFQQVRNALLLLLQHGVATSFPHPSVAKDEATASVMHMYDVVSRDVLVRLRFPHYVDHVRHYYNMQGDMRKGLMASRLLIAVLSDGRVSEEVATRQAQKTLRRQGCDIDLESLQHMFRRLTSDGLIRSYAPYNHPQTETPTSEKEAPATSSAAPALLQNDASAAAMQLAASTPGPPPGAQEAPATSSAAPAPLQNDASAAAVQLVASTPGPPPGAQAPSDADGKRALDSGENGSIEPERKKARSSANEDTNFFGFHRRALDLRLCRDAIVRVVEDKHPLFIAQIFRCALDGITLLASDDADALELDVSTAWLRFGQLEAKAKEEGFLMVGGDPKREREKMRNALALLCAHSDHLLKMRVATAPNDGATSRAATRKRGTAAARASFAKEASAAAAEAAAEGLEVDTKEWAVEWENVRRVLVKSLTSRYVKDQFGSPGLRVFNLLNDRSTPQKLEEEAIKANCMLSVEEAREVLNRMARRSVIRWQEVPKGPSHFSSLWLYYVDPYSVWMLMLRAYVQTILNLRITLRKCTARLQPLEAAIVRAGSIAGLGPTDRQKLYNGRKVEDALERSYLSLAVAPMILTCFTQLPAGS